MRISSSPFLHGCHHLVSFMTLLPFGPSACRALRFPSALMTVRWFLKLLIACSRDLKCFASHNQLVGVGRPTTTPLYKLCLTFLAFFLLHLPSLCALVLSFFTLTPPTAAKKSDEPTVSDEQDLPEAYAPTYAGCHWH